MEVFYVSEIIWKSRGDIITWKVFKYRVFSGSYFPVFGMNTDQKKLRIWTLFTQCVSHELGHLIRYSRVIYVR